MFSGSLLAVLLAAGSLPAEDRDFIPDRQTAIERPRGTLTVIPGTFTWSIERNKLGDSTVCDLWWSTQSDTSRILTPQHGAALAIVQAPFDRVTLGYLKSVKYRDGGISGNPGEDQLRPGTVLALRTGKGDYAKLRVTRYYRKHDFNFLGAKPTLPEGWKKSLQQQNDHPSYNIEVEWVFYKGK